MGNCVGGGAGTENIFKVTNINDDQNSRLVQKGLMEVTTTELIYTDSKSKEDWHWPLKFLRKYGCDGDVFTFEAGRKCPGGEGLYAFETKKASILFEKVARNINQGDLSPMPDSNANVTDSTIMNFPPRRSSTISPAPHTTDTEQPSYTNIDEMGNPLQNGNHTPPNTAESAVPNPNKGGVQYREVVFDKPPEEHPRPSAAPQKGGTSYTQIDFDQTARYNEELRSGGGVLPSTSTPHDRTSSASTSGNLSPTKRTRPNRHRVHTYSSSSATGRDRHVSRSESSFSSQSSLTESSRDVRSPPKHNGGPRHVSTPDSNNPNSSMYQNVNVGVVSEQQYQNVQVGAGDVNQVFDTSTPKQQPNYSNLVLSASAASPHGIPAEGGRGSGVAMVNGDSMTTYAQLELSARGNRNSGGVRQRSMSSSVGSRPRDTTQQPSYTVLDFQNSSTTSETTPISQRSASVSSAPLPSSGTSTVGGIPSVAQQQSIPEEDIATVSTPPGPSHAPSATVVDETKVTYGVLNFPQMEALSKLAHEREQEIEQEKEQREREQQKERERAASSHKKKKRLE